MLMFRCYTIRQVADLLLVGKSTVSRIWQTFNETGTVRKYRIGRPPSSLPDILLPFISALVAVMPHLYADEHLAYLESWTGIRLSVQQLYLAWKVKC